MCIDVCKWKRKTIVIVIKDNNLEISLRPLVISDAPILMELNNNEEIAKCVVGNPRKVNMDEQLRWMTRIKQEKNTLRFMITYQNKSVGTLIISNIDKANKVGNINIKLLPQEQGKGLGTISLKLACQYAFEKVDLYCLTAHILSDNEASQKLFKKVGFSREGILRSRVIKDGIRKDLISYSLIKNELD